MPKDVTHSIDVGAALEKELMRSRKRSHRRPTGMQTRPRRIRVAVLLAIIMSVVLVFASAAAAGVYGFYHGWSLNEDYSSGYSTGWVLNKFAKDTAGFSTTVTWINNVNYGWSGTVTNSNVSTNTTRPDNSTPAEKGYCRANTSGFFGFCEVAG